MKSTPSSRALRASRRANLRCLGIERLEARELLAIDLVSSATAYNVAQGGTSTLTYLDRPISANGRFVAFASDATNLVSGDTNGSSDIFLKDLQTGVVARASTDSNGVQANSGSFGASISGDGRFVTFESGASNLVPGDTNGSSDVFVKDLQTGIITRVSTNSSGTQANGSSARSSISADGRYIAFSSSASNLVSGDSNGTYDIFVKDRQTGATTRVSTDGSGAQANGYSDFPSISGDGRHVAFKSEASSLVSNDSNGTGDIFVKDRQTGAITRASTDSNGAQANSLCDFPSISGDGLYVAFMSHATNLVANDTNNAPDIFVKDLQTGLLARVNTDGGGTPANNYSELPSISSDGRYIAFTSVASNLVPSDNNGQPDVFVKDMQSGAIQRVSTDSSSGQASGASYYPSISGDGQHVAFQSSANNLVIGDGNGLPDIFIKDLVTNQTQAAWPTNMIVANGASDLTEVDRAISDDGRYVAFGSSANNLVPNDTNGADDIFVQDLQTGAITRVSTDSNGLPASSNSFSPTISGSGRYVAFMSAATNLVANDTNNATDIFVKDLQTGVLTRVSTDASGRQANNVSDSPSISSDGRYVAFRSLAGNLVPSAFNGTNNIYVKDLQTGAITRASEDAIGNSASGPSDYPSISGNGRYVSFTSYANNLAAGDTNNAPDIFVKDLQTGAIKLASTTISGAIAFSASFYPSLTSDGRYVAFMSVASNLVTGDTNGQPDIFVKDMQTGAITRVSTDNNGLQANNLSYFPSISGDGQRIAFMSVASNLVSADTNGSVDIFVKELQSGAIRRVSTDSSGVQANGTSYYPSLSRDGQHVAFRSSANNLALGDTNGSTSDIFVKDLSSNQTQVLWPASRTFSNGYPTVANAYNTLQDEKSAISANGRYVAFASDASNLIPNDTNGRSDVFVKDLQTGSITRASTDTNGNQVFGSSSAPSISTSGRYVVFLSDAFTQVPGDTINAPDIFVKDLQTGVLTHVSKIFDPMQGGRLKVDVSVSKDGRFVAFSSIASSLVPGDTNGQSDIFVKDLQTGMITRVSTASSGAQSNDGSYDPSISADGRFVEFMSLANNLVPGDTNAQPDIFVKDLWNGVITRVSTNGTGAQANDGSNFSSISADGQYVAFMSFASNLVAGDTNNSPDIFVKNLQSGETTRVSTDSSGTQGNNYSELPSVSADGRYVAFMSDSSNLVLGDYNGTWDIFVKDLHTGVTTRVSVDSSGTQANSYSYFPSISGDGQHIAFMSFASNLVLGDSNGQPDIFVYHRGEFNHEPTLSGHLASVTDEEAASYSVDLLTGASDRDFSDVLSVRNLALEGGNASGITLNGNSLLVNPSAYNYLAIGQNAVVQYSYLVIDGQGGQVSQTAIITIQGRNDRPTALTDANDSPNSISEFVANGAHVGITARSIDPDGDTIIYSLLDNAGGRFGIDSDSGAVMVADASLLDYETAISHTITVLASDGDLSRTQNFTIEIANVNEATGLDVQNGQTQRSYVRTLDMMFEDYAGLDTMIAQGRIRLDRYALDGAGPAVSVSMAGLVSRTGNQVRIDFGTPGLGGNRNTTAGDGYYELSADNDGNGTYESVLHFYRLLGDVNGDGTVSHLDASLILNAYGKSDPERDTNGDGTVNAIDRTLAIRSLGLSLNLSLDLDD